jgi:hypothetical protein
MDCEQQHVTVWSCVLESQTCRYLWLTYTAFYYYYYYHHHQLFWGTLLVAQLVEALRYKPELAGSIPDGVPRIFFSMTQSFQPHYGPGVD